MTQEQFRKFCKVLRRLVPGHEEGRTKEQLHARWQELEERVGRKVTPHEIFALAEMKPKVLAAKMGWGKLPKTAGPKIMPRDNTPPSLEEAQAWVGGSVEIISLHDPMVGPIQLLVNEEGLLKGLPVNSLASSMAGRKIVGNVMVLVRGALWK